MSEVLSVLRGDAPLLISVPHDGQRLPPEVARRMTAAGLAVADTDWHMGHFYLPLAERLGATLLRPHHSRYLIDLNRPADGAALYPGRRETGLCPLISFAEEALYLDGQGPSAEEIAQRVERWWRPYHDCLAAELARLRERHPRVVLWEGHSIRSRVPLFFEGQLPHFNLGTAAGQSASAELASRLVAELAQQQRYSHVLDGRFRGGYITRHYGRPEAGIHAVQLEMAQISYMDEQSPQVWDADRAADAQHWVGRLLQRALEWVGAGADLAS